MTVRFCTSCDRPLPAPAVNGSVAPSFEAAQRSLVALGRIVCIRNDPAEDQSIDHQAEPCVIERTILERTRDRLRDSIAEGTKIAETLEEQVGHVRGAVNDAEESLTLVVAELERRC